MDLKYTSLVEPSGISGVGKGVIPVNHAVTVPIGIPGTGQSNFKGLVLPSSQVPALLGLKSMQKKHTILDLREGHLHMWTADKESDLEIRSKPGASGVSRIQLEQAASGHLLLPCTAYKDAEARPMGGSSAYPTQQQ